MVTPDASIHGDVSSYALSSILQPVLWGTLIAGTLDIAAAMASVAASGLPAVQAIKGVASGWMGTKAFRGQGEIIALGLLTHFAIMLVIVAVYCWSARQFPLLTKYWIAAGVTYGAVVYATMTYVVVPFSAFPGTLAGSMTAVLQGLLVHCVCVGLPIAFIAHRFLSRANV